MLFSFLFLNNNEVIDGFLKGCGEKINEGFYCVQAFLVIATFTRVG